MMNTQSTLQDDFFVFLEQQKRHEESPFYLNAVPGGYLNEKEIQENFIGFSYELIAEFVNPDDSSVLQEGGYSHSQAKAAGASRIFYVVYGRKDVSDPSVNPEWPLHEVDTESEALELCDSLKQLINLKRA